MATATAKVAQEEQIALVEVPDGVTLELSQDEAQLLTDVLASVGGNPEKSRRKFAASVLDALYVAGYRYIQYDDPRHDKDGRLWFGETAL